MLILAYSWMRVVWCGAASKFRWLYNKSMNTSSSSLPPLLLSSLLIAYCFGLFMMMMTSGRRCWNTLYSINNKTRTGRRRRRRRRRNITIGCQCWIRASRAHQRRWLPRLQTKSQILRGGGGRRRGGGGGGRRRRITLVWPTPIQAIGRQTVRAICFDRVLIDQNLLISNDLGGGGGGGVGGGMRRRRRRNEEDI